MTELAAHLSRRQVEIAAAALQAQGRGVTIKFEEFDNELADMTKDRMTTILGALATGSGHRGTRRLPGSCLGRDWHGRRGYSRLEAAFAEAATFLETLSALGDPQKPLSQAEQALQALTEQFADLSDQARQYGVSVGVIDQAMKRQLTTFWDAVVENLKTQQQNMLQRHWAPHARAWKRPS